MKQVQDSIPQIRIPVRNHHSLEYRSWVQMYRSYAYGKRHRFMRETHLHKLQTSISSLKSGLYDHLVNNALQRSLETDPRLAFFGDIDADEAHAVLAQYLEHQLANAFSLYRGGDGAERQRKLVERIVAILVEEIGEEVADTVSVATPLRRLLAIQESTDGFEPPDSPLSRSALFSGTRMDPSLGTQFCKELANCDRVDILCSFIRWTGLRVLLASLRKLANVKTDSGPRIRVITTSYMGATEARAIEELSRLPNTEIRISYDTKRTRLHAKAYVFHRETGFGSAYIGSANLSGAAMAEGLEWTTKISQYELPYLWAKISATFESYWQDDEFQLFETSDGQLLRQALTTESNRERTPDAIYAFDLRPYPFQEELLDLIAAERRVHGKHTHLIVAATGTGKTMVSAFDYARVARELGRRPRLIFVAHREEILRQALGTFRSVLRDQNFGDLFVGGIEPGQSEHLFCSIDTYNSRELWRQPNDAFEYIVVDEFHHAAAPSYRMLLDNVRPNYLLGLTATPERSDRLDVYHWFGGRSTAEIRLPDAINRRLLCPFQYFGVSDSVNLENLVWRRGGYRVEDLDQIYTGNDIRANLILEKVHEILHSPLNARGLGFCVSIAHAEFMAQFFTSRGIPSLALSGLTTKEARRSAQDQLVSRQLNFLFVVDLYNEGVDIPELDTVLFLRPTESLTVFLQQLGRGLRLHPEKECLTVLDFIGSHRREFRFASRFQSLSSNPAVNVQKEVESGFPHLPSGCSIQLERVAQQHVIKNIRESINSTRPRMITCLSEFGNLLGRKPTLDETLDYLDVSLDALLSRGLWSRMLAEAGLASAPIAPDEERLSKGLHRFSHADDLHRIEGILDYIERISDGAMNPGRNPMDDRLMTMLHISLWAEECKGWSLEEATNRLRRNPAVLDDLRDILLLQLKHAQIAESPSSPENCGPLVVHGTYSRDEILAALGYWSLDSRPGQREGVLHLPQSKIDAFFVTIQKSENDYSPTTMYEDYLISHDLIHWQSQSRTSAESPTGRRYIEHRSRDYTPLLFVRDTRKLASGKSSPYVFLGKCEYVSHEGSRPMSILWRLHSPVPSRYFRRLTRHLIA